MRPVRPALEFRMELNPDKEVLSRNLNRLNQPPVRRLSGKAKPGLLQRLPVFIRKFVPVPVYIRLFV